MNQKLYAIFLGEAQITAWKPSADEAWDAFKRSNSVLLADPRVALREKP